MASWKTTVCGVIALVTIVLGTAQSLIGGTHVDWSVVVPGIMAGLTGLFARDNKVTSEQANAG